MENNRSYIDFHDSYMSSVEFSEDRVILYFESLVVIDLLDDCGLSFENTRFMAGTIEMTQAQFGHLSKASYLASGKVSFENETFELIPINFQRLGACVLELNFEDGQLFKVTGSSLTVSVKEPVDAK